MSEEAKIVDHLMVHAAFCQQAAAQCWNEDIAVELEKLATDCRRTALEMAKHVFTHWTH